MVAEQFSRVLVVEGDDAQRQLVCGWLHEEGFEATGCGTASEALGLVRQSTFSVAVVGSRLPNARGNQLLQKMRSLDADLRMVIYTSDPSHDSRNEATSLGAFACIERLGDRSELLKHVNRAYQQRVDLYADDVEDAVARRAQDLARSNRELDDFASVVAHDMRSPLLTISGYCQLLQEACAGQLPGESSEYLDHIVGGVERINGLIEGLLDYARAGRSEEPFRPVDLESVLVQAKANLEVAIQESRAQFEVGSLPEVAGNHALLVQLFQNLIGNAIKFRGPSEPLLRLSATRVDDRWQFALQDNGIGIDPGDFERVFKVFERLHGKAYPGSGIGLAVCKKIVERHGGAIWVESKPDCGTTFFFTLADPLADPPIA
ncbi:MAG: response regulator [Pirellulales bacterium]|nr:response regulator [Pirellulales bacterium]